MTSKDVVRPDVRGHGAGTQIKEVAGYCPAWGLTSQAMWRMTFPLTM
jgi:hypothetical protein